MDKDTEIRCKLTTIVTMLDDLRTFLFLLTLVCNELEDTSGTPEGNALGVIRDRVEDLTIELKDEVKQLYGLV